MDNNFLLNYEFKKFIKFIIKLQYYLNNLENILINITNKYKI